MLLKISPVGRPAFRITPLAFNLNILGYSDLHPLSDVFCSTYLAPFVSMACDRHCASSLLRPRSAARQRLT